MGLQVMTMNRSLRRAYEAQERRDAKKRVRELAAGGFSTSSSAGASLTVNSLLRQPRTISRDVLNVVLQRGGFLADRLLVKGSPDEVAGGSMLIQRTAAAGSYLDDDLEEIAEDADWPRTGWTEETRTEAVKQYGLEVPITNLAVRRNQLSQVTRAERRLANQTVKFVDGRAITMLRTDPDVQNIPAGNWTNPAFDLIGEIAGAQESMDVLDEGFNPSTLVLPKTMRVHFLGNADLRDALKTNNGSEAVRTGNVSNFLGLDNIYFSNSIPDDEALLLDTGIAGTIADEAPDPSEGWVGYDPGGGFSTIWVMVYEEKRPKRKVIAAGRWPGMGLVVPEAVVRFTSTTS